MLLVNNSRTKIIRLLKLVVIPLKWFGLVLVSPAVAPRFVMSCFLRVGVRRSARCISNCSRRGLSSSSSLHHLPHLLHFVGLRCSVEAHVSHDLLHHLIGLALHRPVRSIVTFLSSVGIRDFHSGSNGTVPSKCSFLSFYFHVSFRQKVVCVLTRVSSHPSPSGPRACRGSVVIFFV